ncbi:hypothetical protein BJV78DRAFT_1203328 [Lactifluus subvellereus]|nr:hypothetical protein BJV78DRAFT_1203328 [Lactifluus subvellereus]
MICVPCGASMAMRLEISMLAKTKHESGLERWTSGYFRMEGCSNTLPGSWRNRLWEKRCVHLRLFASKEPKGSKLHGYIIQPCGWEERDKKTTVHSRKHILGYCGAIAGPRGGTKTCLQRGHHGPFMHAPNSLDPCSSKHTLRMPLPTIAVGSRLSEGLEYCPDKYPEIDHDHAVVAGASWADKLSSGSYIQPHVLSIYPLA